jgi:hypothetical protein
MENQAVACASCTPVALRHAGGAGARTPLVPNTGGSRLGSETPRMVLESSSKLLGSYEGSSGHYRSLGLVCAASRATSMSGAS